MAQLLRQLQDFGGHGVTRPLPRDVQWCVLHPFERDEGFDPAERRVPRQALTPIPLCSRASPRTPRWPPGRRSSAGSSRGVGAPRRNDVLHDHQVGALLVDEPRRPSDGQAAERLPTRTTGVTEQATRECDEIGVGRVDRLGEHCCGPGAVRVCQPRRARLLVPSSRSATRTPSTRAPGQ